MKLKNIGSFFLYVLPCCCVPATYILGSLYAEQVTNIVLPKQTLDILKQLEDESGGNRLQWPGSNIDKGSESGPSYSGNDLILDKYLYSNVCDEYFNIFHLLLNGNIAGIRDLEYYGELYIYYYTGEGKGEGEVKGGGKGEGKLSLKDLKSDVEEAISILQSVEERYTLDKRSYPTTFPEGQKNVTEEDLEQSVCSPIRRAASDYAKQILALYHKRLKVYTRQMNLFYNYLTWEGVDDLMIIPEWNTVPANNCPFGLKNSTSATHTEFMMVYKILQDKGMPRREDGLLKMDSTEDFDRALSILKWHLPAEIYSAKAMCPVCEAFLTSLYNLCGCEGVFISNLDDYNSPSGPAGTLKKVYLNAIKGCTYVDLPPDHKKKPRQ